MERVPSFRGCPSFCRAAAKPAIQGLRRAFFEAIVARLCLVRFLVSAHSWARGSALAQHDNRFLRKLSLMYSQSIFIYPQ
jgi:hypothetical protein